MNEKTSKILTSYDQKKIVSLILDNPMIFGAKMLPIIANIRKSLASVYMITDELNLSDEKINELEKIAMKLIDDDLFKPLKLGEVLITIEIFKTLIDVATLIDNMPKDKMIMLFGRDISP